MKAKEIKECPFRIGKVTSLSATVKGESYTNEYFMPCDKSDCPAFHVTCDGLEEYEHCLRLDSIKAGKK
jgi:hypothetical protein